MRLFADIFTILPDIGICKSYTGSREQLKTKKGIKSMDYVKAFIVGGIICVLTQILMEKTKLMPGRIMVILVTSGIVLGAVGLYEPLVQFAGAGASVPLTGFGNVLWKGMKMAVDNAGFLGLFKGGFQSCAVGVSAALIFGYIASWVFDPKMKKK